MRSLIVSLSIGLRCPLLFDTCSISLQHIVTNYGCECRYGKAWQKYCALVPHKIVPGLY